MMDGEDMRRAVHRISHEILETHKGVDDLVLVGIHTRGVHLAHWLAETIERFEDAPVPVGELEVGPYRDDRGMRGPRPERASVLPPIDGKSVIVVDDVLYTGRTVRAALDALLDEGRAASIKLAVLVDRGHRELPIRADFVGKNIPTARAETVQVRLAPHDHTEGVWLEKGEAA